MKNISFGVLRKKSALITAVAALLLGGFAGWFLFGRGKNDIVLVAVRRGEIVQEVTVTGKTKARTSVDLGFDRSGRISRVYADVGDRAAVGSPLAEVDSQELRAQLREARGAVDAAEAKFAELRRGTRSENLRIQETKRETAVEDAIEAKENLLDALRSAYSRTEDLVDGTVDAVFENPHTTGAITVFRTGDAAWDQRLALERVQTETRLREWQESLAHLSPEAPASRMQTEGTFARQNLERTRSFIEDVSRAVTALPPGAVFTQSALDAWRSNLSLARSGLSAEIASVSAAAQKLSAAEGGLKIAEQELMLSRAGATPEEIMAQEALVRQQKSRVDALAVQIASTVLRSPIAGIVTKQDGRPGEIAQAGKTVASVLAESDFEIEANVPEVDIGNVAATNPVKIELDAFSNESFRGRVVSVDPAETIVDGVVHFRVRINFEKPDPRIKSGLTANVEIQTRTKSNVLLLPQSALTERDNGVFVKRVRNGKTEEIPVTVGIRGSDARVEILTGLAEGDSVINAGLRSAENK